MRLVSGSFNTARYCVNSFDSSRSWNGTASTPITSIAAVNDGLWHHAVLTATGNTQYLDIDGKLKTPQLLYFLNRIKAEFDTSTPDKRSFMPELERSADDKSL